MRALGCLAAIPLLVRAAIEADRVTSLPGYSSPLPFAMYSGYITTPLVRRHALFLFRSD